MTRWIIRLTLVLAALAAGASATVASAQVTTGSIRGIVTDSDNRPIEGARIIALHLPSGTQYTGATRGDGRFNIPGMRVGGPYQVSATMIGYARQSRDDIMVSLGAAADLVFPMSAVATQLSAVTVTSEGGEMSSTRTGAATQVRRDQMQALPTVSRRLSDFTRLTPQAQSGGTSFAGYDDRLNNITVDGASFNNSFGLAGSPGDRTRVAPISMDAIEAVQVNIAPFDVRQAGFVGAGVNTVTRSGTNSWQGALYYTYRNNEMVGTKAGRGTFNPGEFDFDLLGLSLGGPIVKNKLFFFVNYEDDKIESPLTTLRANTGTQTIGGNVTRVLESDLIALQNYMRTNFNRELGPYQGYAGLTPSRRLTMKVDYALSERNKFSLRYSTLESSTDVRTSGSSSLGFLRAQGTDWLGFKSSNYSILENINSVSAEWNALLTDRMSNQLVFTQSKHDESRGPIGELFPFIDILQGSSAYTSLGSEPFTPNNELRYESTQVQNNFTIFGNRHDLTFGVSVEMYKSENVFFPGSQSAYVYNSLADFYTDLNDFLSQCPDPTTWSGPTACSRASSPVPLNRFQVRWANIEGMTKPIQPLEVTYAGVYAQDEWRIRSNLTLVGGLRVDRASFAETGFTNPNTNAMTFRDENGNAVQYETQKLPAAKPLISPRIGFNYDLRGNGATVLRGGTGVFTGRPAYVWISNQVGENGMLTGAEECPNTVGCTATSRPFHPDPNHYKPAPSGLPAASTALAITDNDFKFPQVWRTSLGLDHRFESGWRATLDFLWGRDVNGIYYINANLPEAQTAFTGPDTRSRWTSNRINGTVNNAIVMKNQNVGESYSAALSLERTWLSGFFTKFATAYGDSKNTIDPGSIAFGSWENNVQNDDPNNPGVGRSSNFQGRRTFLALAYTKDFFGWGDTKISTFIENRTQGSASYRFSNDANGDGARFNDLIYVPRDASEMNFQQFTRCMVATSPCPAASVRTYTVAEQMAAWDAYINQDPYLRTRRGQYAERNGLILPQITRMDLSFSQDVSRLVSGQRNTLQFRVDILNFTNMINSDWGGGVRVIDVSPLTAVAPTTGAHPQAGQLRYTMRTIGTAGPLVSQTYQKTAFEGDVWRMQFGFRYTFN